MDGGHELPDMTSTHLISSEREEEREEGEGEEGEVGECRVQQNTHTN